MSLTILFQTPVDTGTAKISPKVENPNLKDFYLLIGKISLVNFCCDAPFSYNNSIYQAL